MYDKINQSNKIQQSPPGPIDFHSKQMPSHLKPVAKTSHNQSFDSFPVHNQLVAHQAQHGTKIRGDHNSKLVTSGQNTIKNSYITHSS